MRAALDQTGAEMLFKRAHLSRDCWLRDAPLLRHGRERTDLGDTKEGAECSNQIHGSYLRYQMLLGGHGFAAAGSTLNFKAT
jgi:hypothetical protein